MLQTKLKMLESTLILYPCTCPHVCDIQNLRSFTFFLNRSYGAVCSCEVFRGGRFFCFFRKGGNRDTLATTVATRRIRGRFFCFFGEGEFRDIVAVTRVIPARGVDVVYT